MNDGFTAMKMEELNMEPRELSLNELDEASGGFIWIAAVVGGFAPDGDPLRYRLGRRSVPLEPERLRGNRKPLAF